MCLDDFLLKDIKKLNYIPVGLGSNNFSSDWLTDKSGDNISSKNKYYGEHTFYYWFWKNMLPKMVDNTWIGFCGYRHHWSNNNQFKSDDITKVVNKTNFDSFILKNSHDQWKTYDIILGEDVYINKWKLSKIIKHGYKVLLRPTIQIEHETIFTGDKIDFTFNEKRGALYTAKGDCKKR